MTGLTCLAVLTNVSFLPVRRGALLTLLTHFAKPTLCLLVSFSISTIVASHGCMRLLA